MKKIILPFAFLSLVLSANFSTTKRLFDQFTARQNNDEDIHKPENALKGLDVAEGLEAQLFAAEPMLTNPTNIDIDHRGRVWVCEGYNYRPEITGNDINPKGDRILILEDTNQDGKADIQKIFYQGAEINAPLGIWVMGNRAIVSQSPYVWLFTDTDGDDKADKKEVLFQGAKGEQHDHGLHAFVFGPDGKFYFNFGNAGEELRDGKGDLLKDADGKEVSLKNYKQGLVFRCDPDMSNFEVLGQNFRNNFEVAIDSYGTMWQSDNDDDGNKSVRINYVMEHGNFGYTDEITGAGWSANRTNIEEEIPQRHWHLNDPGVVPNMLQTGAGSPTGILFYEGSLLPAAFQNQIIHCDAGPNVVRAYPTEKSGAGYKASIKNILHGARNQWFRPSDVCVAPDGSLLISDWYDPGVGGHQAGDLGRGRIFRIAQPNTPYKTPIFDFTTPEGATAALQNPNLSVRYLAWNALQKMGTDAENTLQKLLESDKPHLRARALWALGKMPNKGEKYINWAIESGNSELKIAGIRLARQLKLDVASVIEKLVNDADPQVRRECALALRHNTSPKAPALWAKLAQQHKGQDRWYLEALGIGAEQQWDKYFAAWQEAEKGNELNNVGNRDIVWRARTKSAVPLLASLASDNSNDLKTRLRYFRAFDFQPDADSKSAALVDMMKLKDLEVNKLVLSHLSPEHLKKSPLAQTALKEQLDADYGKTAYLELVERYEPVAENPRLLQMALQNSFTGLARNATRQLLKQGGEPLIWSVLNNKKNETAAINALASLRLIGNKSSLEILKKVAQNTKNSKAVRREAFRFIGNSWDGEEEIIAMLKNNQVPEEYKPVAVQGVSFAWRRNIRTQAASFLGAKGNEGKALAPIAELIKLNGNARNGVQMFAQQCAVCHQVGDEGMDFGPKLTEIGGKLPKEGLYLAILHPDAGISFGYEGWEVKLKDGSTVAGIVASKTETDLQMKFAGGTTQNYKMAEVKSMKKMDSSMMTPVHENLNQQELVDLVEYLAALKR